MRYLSLSRDSFDAWCDAVNIQSYKYEFSNRTYFISGEFYSKADKEEIIRIKKIHGIENWQNYYPKFKDVLPYLKEEEPQPKRVKENYKPKSTVIADFINGLKNEKSNTK